MKLRSSKEFSNLCGRTRVTGFVDSPYRNDRTPLQERREALRRDLERSEARLADLAREGERRQEIEQELRLVETELRVADNRRVLPQLRDVHVAAPCPADWDAMVGDDTTRFCGSCTKNVYNLSAMTTAEAEAFLARTFGEDTCVRFYRRADGTLLTADCPVGVSRRRKKKVAVALAAVGTTAAAALHLAAGPVLHPSHVVMGELVRVEPTPAPVTAPDAPPGRWVAGGIAPAPKPHGKNPKGYVECEAGDPLCSHE